VLRIPSVCCCSRDFSIPSAAVAAISQSRLVLHKVPNAIAKSRDYDNLTTFLTLGQIHSTLACDWDHQAELDRDVERRPERADRIQREVQPSPLVARLKAQGLI
jgi:hypothetical protein